MSGWFSVLAGDRRVFRGFGFDLGGDFAGFGGVHFFVEVVVDEDDGSGAAAGETLDGHFAVGGGFTELDAELFLEGLAGLVATRERARERAADLDVTAADRLAAEHRVE